MSKRKVGLSYRDKPPPLLNVVRTKKSTREEVPVDAPPLSTDDEDSIENVGSDDQRETPNISQKLTNSSSRSRGSAPDAILGSSGDEGAAQANILRTNFDKPTRFGKPQQGTTRKGRSDGSPKSDTKKSDDGPPSSKKRRQIDDSSDRRGQEPSATPPSSGAHCTDNNGFTKRKPSKNTYGGKRRGAVSDEPEKGKNAVTKRLLPQNPTRASSSAKSRIRVPKSRFPNSPLEVKKKLKAPGSLTASSPAQGGALTALQIPTQKHDRLLDDKSSPSTKRSQSPPKTFIKIPAEFPRLVAEAGGGNKADAALSGSASDTEHSSSPSPAPEVLGDDADLATAATVCPWCGQPVEKSLLAEFAQGKRMNVRLQTSFCRNHKRLTAEETWRSRNYPEVEWQDLDQRFAAHRSYLLDVVNGEPSHFRSILARKIESGQARSMKKQGDMNPGYYGPRGFNLMCDYLVEEFGELLKRKAVDDRVIAGRGSAAFIQCVLVAELAVQLIQDDMGVSVEEARRIMEESKALGEMLHEET